MLQEFDTIIVESDPSLQQLRFSRVPAPQEEADEAAGDDASSVSSTSSFNKQAKQQQQIAQQQDAQPIPVEIPNIIRHVNSFGRMSAGSLGGAQPPQPAVDPGAALPSAKAAAAAAGGSSSSSGKFDPLGGKKKGVKAAQKQQQPPAAVPAAMNGSSAAAAEDEGGDGPPNLVGDLPQEGSTNSLADLMAGLDADVASHLDPANLPAFLRTPERRDGQDSLPTQSY
jgi:hypothetical protein